MSRLIEEGYGLTTRALVRLDGRERSGSWSHRNLYERLAARQVRERRRRRFAARRAGLRFGKVDRPKPPRLYSLVAVTVNGEPAGEISGYTSRRSGWWEFHEPASV